MPAPHRNACISLSSGGGSTHRLIRVGRLPLGRFSKPEGINRRRPVARLASYPAITSTPQGRISYEQAIGTVQQV